MKKKGYILLLSACTAENKKVAYEDIKLNATDIFEIYMDKYPSTKIAKIELDTNHGTFIIGFSVSKNHISVSPESITISTFEKNIKEVGYK